MLWSTPHWSDIVLLLYVLLRSNHLRTVLTLYSCCMCYCVLNSSAQVWRCSPAACVTLFLSSLHCSDTVLLLYVWLCSDHLRTGLTLFSCCMCHCVLFISALVWHCSPAVCVTVFWSSPHWSDTVLLLYVLLCSDHLRTGLTLFSCCICYCVLIISALVWYS